MDATNFDEEEITYTSSVRDTIVGTIDHEKTLDHFEDFLSERGFTGGERDHSDLIMQSEEHVILGEAKMIHANNEATQIRQGLGQLLEYRHRDILHNTGLASRPLTRYLILSQQPSAEYQNILRSVEDDGIYTVWIEDDQVAGLEMSMDRLSEITAN